MLLLFTHSQAVLSAFHRLACRDIGGSDPERMASPRVADYVQELFKDSPVKVRERLCHVSKQKSCLALLQTKLKNIICVYSPVGGGVERHEGYGEGVSLSGCSQPLCQQYENILFHFIVDIDTEGCTFILIFSLFTPFWPHYQTA